MCKTWTFGKAQGAEEGKGGQNSTADGYGKEAELFEDHIEDKDEDSPCASAGSLYYMLRLGQK